MKASEKAFLKIMLVVGVCAVILSCSLIFQTSGSAEAAEANVLFILDGSGSMWGKLEGDVEKITIAKRRMIEVVQGWDNAKMGLIVYGQRRKGDCDDIELLVPLETGNRGAVIQHIQSVSPKGKTPIQRSIAMAAQQLETLEEETEIVLISDGLETCDDDPCGYVQRLKGKGIKFTLDVVGFDISDKERGQLECLANAGGGRYFTAQNAIQLTEAFTEVKKEVAKKVGASVYSKTGLVAYYPFDGNANDKSGTGNHGKEIGATRYTDGKLGKAALFSGKNFIEVNDHDSLDLSTAFTFSVWLYKEDAGVGGWAVVLTKCDVAKYTAERCSYGLHHDESGLSPWVRFPGELFDIQMSQKIGFKKWYLLTTTWDGSNVNFYIDGKLRDTKAYKGSLPKTASKLLIGIDPPWDTEYFKGKMDDLRIYNRALSESEIQALYHEGSQ